MMNAALVVDVTKKRVEASGLIKRIDRPRPHDHTIFDGNDFAGGSIARGVDLDATHNLLLDRLAGLWVCVDLALKPALRTVIDAQANALAPAIYCVNKFDARQLKRILNCGQVVRSRRSSPFFKIDDHIA